MPGQPDAYDEFLERGDLPAALRALEAYEAADAGEEPLEKALIEHVRGGIGDEFGVRIPGIRIRGGSGMRGTDYVILVDEVPIAGATIPQPDRLYCLADPAELSAEGLHAYPFLDPATGNTISIVRPSGANRRFSSAGPCLPRAS